MKQAIQGDRTTVYNAIKQAGHPELAGTYKETLIWLFLETFFAPSFKKELMEAKHNFTAASDVFFFCWRYMTTTRVLQRQLLIH